MQKVLNYVEKYVEWLAILLGVAWLLWMGWSYFAKPPVKATVGGTVESPGSVDTYVAENAATALKRDIDDPTVPKMSVPSFAQHFVSVMKWDGVVAPPTPNPWVNSLPIKLENPDQPAGPGNPNAQLVKALPVLPAPTFLGMSSGRSTVQMPANVGAAGQPAVAPAAAPGDVDRDWVTQFYSIPFKALQNAFVAAKLPPQLQNTCFLALDLVREEQMPDGSWGNDTLIGSLPIHPLQPFPPAKNLPAMNAFLQWAQQPQVTKDMVQPDFYTVDKGDPWKTYQDLNPNGLAAVNQPVVAPKAPLPVAPPPPPAPRRAPVPSRRPGAPAGGPTGPDAMRPTPSPFEGVLASATGLSDDTVAAADPRTTAQSAFVIPVQQFRGPQSPPPQPDAAAMDQPPGDNGAQPVAPSVANFPAAPGGSFVPAMVAADITVWAHDDTIQPSKTYRYKVRYRLKNPIFSVNGVATNPALAQQFSLDSPDTPWGAPISVPAKIRFFLVSGKAPQHNDVRMEIFKWQGGSTKQQKMNAALPGDPVGDGDFATGWTIVDVRSDPADTTLILVGDDGSFIRKRYNEDRSDPALKKLRDDAAAAAKAAAPVAAAPAP